VGRIQGICLHGDLVLQVVTLLTTVASHDILKIGDFGSSGALLSDGLVVGSRIILLNTVQEVERLRRARNEVLGAGLDHVVVALSDSMLAGKLPFSGRILRLMSVSVWPEVKFSHVKEAISLHSLGEGLSYHLLAAWALTLEEEVNLDFVIISLLF
jgi:hypothetical protein